MQRNNDAMLAVSPDDLAMFIRVVTLGSFSAAAREHNQPPSRASRAVQRLEQHWQVRLLRRSTHGLSLTPEGEVVLELGQRTLASLAEIGERLAEPRGQISGTVRLALVASFAEGLIVPALPRLAAAHPALQVDLISDDLASDFSLQGVDIALRVGSVLDQNLVARQVGSFSRRLFASPAYLAAHGCPQTPADLPAHHFVTHRQLPHLNSLRLCVEGQMHEQMLHGRYTANTTAILERLVLHGLGIGYLNELFMRMALARGEVLELLAAWHDPTRYPIYAVCLPDRQRLPRIQAVLDFLQQVMSESAA